MNTDKYIFRVIAPFKNPNDEIGETLKTSIGTILGGMLYGMDTGAYRIKLDEGISVELVTENGDNLLGVLNGMKGLRTTLSEDGEIDLDEVAIEYAKLPDLEEWFPIIKLVMDEKVSEMSGL